jgi:hypothetical protein
LAVVVIAVDWQVGHAAGAISSGFDGRPVRPPRESKVSIIPPVMCFGEG